MCYMKQFFEQKWKQSSLSLPGVICILQGFFCFILLFLFHWVFPFTSDSFQYISTAQHISSFQGLSSIHFFPDIPTPDILLNHIWPPGYPILIAALKLFGIKEYTGSLLWPYLGFVSLPFLFFLVFRKLMPIRVALVASFVCTFMFSVLRCALMAWSDIPYLCFSLLSLAAAFHIIEKQAKVGSGFILFAGILAGYSFLIRYIGVTLVASMMIGFVVSFLLRMIAAKDFIKTICFYVLGILLVVLPYLIRNLVVFGEIQPYHTVLPEFSLLTNLHDYFQGLGQVFFVKRSWEGLVLGVLLGFVIYFVIHVKNWIKQRKAWFIYAVILSVYFFLDSILLIVQWTTTFQAEHINERYLIQLAWILAGGLIFCVHAVLTKLFRFQPGVIKFVVGVLILFFFVIQIFPASAFWVRQRQDLYLAKMVAAYVPILKRVPVEYVIVSNVSDQAYYFSKRNVRWIGNNSPDDLRRLFRSKRKFVVFLFKRGRAFYFSGKLAELWKTSHGYKVIFSDKFVSLLIPQ